MYKQCNFPLKEPWNPLGPTLLGGQSKHDVRGFIQTPFDKKLHYLYLVKIIFYVYIVDVEFG